MVPTRRGRDIDLTQIPHAAAAEQWPGASTSRDTAHPMPVSPSVTPIQAALPKVSCATCRLREMCLPAGLSPDDLERLESIVDARRSLRRGETLFRNGDRFDAIYAVRSGFFKTCLTSPDRRDQVIGFQMAGDLLGLDGIGSGQHSCEAVALEDSNVCVIPYDALENVSRDTVALQRQLHRMLSREIVREQGVMLLLGSMRAEERVAAFVLNLWKRLELHGPSVSTLVLRMTREELGTYLGLTIETVSRCFSKLHDDSVLAVRQRNIRILDRGALDRLVNGRPAPPAVALATGTSGPAAGCGAGANSAGGMSLP
jgi:CRP/FNR family transcriptional regulator